MFTFGYTKLDKFCLQNTKKYSKIHQYLSASWT